MTCLRDLLIRGIGSSVTAFGEHWPPYSLKRGYVGRRGWFGAGVVEAEARLQQLEGAAHVGGPSIDARMSKTRLAMPEADQELLSLRAQARRQPLQRRIIRSVASSTAIETRQQISSIEAKLLASNQVVVNRRLVTLA